MTHENPIPGSLAVRAPAKLNLVLDVLRKREDGFHDLRSLMVTVGLCDELRFQPSTRPEVILQSDHNDLACDRSNLVFQAAQSLQTHLDKQVGCTIELRKRIPLGGGLGGGSSDAAATLLALNQLWDAGVDLDSLSRLGSQLGSDIPFFFHGPSAIITGRGDRVEPVRMKWSGWAMLIWAGVQVSTPQTYACLDSIRDRDGGEAVGAALAASSAEELNALLRNDLEDAVFRIAPAVGQLRDRLLQLGWPVARVSGAGSVLFALSDDEEEAQHCLRRLQASGMNHDAWVVEVPAPSS